MMQRFAAATGQHWAQINEFSFVAGMRLLFWLCRVLGRWPFRAVLYPVLLWYFVARPATRAASRDYLKRVAAFGATTRVTQGWCGVLRHFSAFAESILDKMLVWSGLFNYEEVRFFGQDVIKERVAAQRGGLLICCHLGNLELCRVLSQRLTGLKITVLVHTKHALKFNRLLAQMDSTSQLDLMQVTELTPGTAILLAEKINQGEWIAIAGDRIPVSPRPRVARVRFLGEMAPLPVGPYILAGLFRCPSYLMFSLRNGRTSEIHFERFREVIRLPREGRDAALAALAADYAQRLDQFCLRAPLQWFNFYDFWHLPKMETADAQN